MKKDGKYFSPINGEELSLDSDGFLHSPTNSMIFMIDKNDNIVPLRTDKETPLYKSENGLYTTENKDEQYKVYDDGRIEPLKDPYTEGNLKLNTNGNYTSEITGLNFAYDEKRNAMVPLYIPDDTKEPAHIESGFLVGETSGRRYEIPESGLVEIEEAQEFKNIKEIKEEVPEIQVLDNLKASQDIPENQSLGNLELKQDEEEPNIIEGLAVAEEVLSKVEESNLKKQESKSTENDSFDVSILATGDYGITSAPKSPSSSTVNEFGEIIRNPIDPYGEYRENMARIFEEQKDPDTVLSSTYTVVNGEKPVCYHQLERITGDVRQIVQQQVFDYTQEFKDGMLEPSITDYAQRSPMSESKVIGNPDYPEVSHFQTFSTNNNMLSINNIETGYAHNISNAIHMIDPIVFKQNMQQKAKGPVLSKMPVTAKGFINSLMTSVIIGFFCGLLSWLIVLCYYHQ